MSLESTYRGLKVLDLGTNIAAPVAAMMLGDLGADVIKVERPPGGDDTRALPPFWNGAATVFLAVNRNKRSVALDIKTAEGREALLKMVETADVVIESFPPGLAEKLKLSFEDFRGRNPCLVLCSVSAFGDGPVGAGMPGYDALVQAVSGLMSFTGHAGSEPVRLAPSVLDLTTGMWSLVGIMAALARRDAGGVSRHDANAAHVRPSLIDSAFMLMCHQVLGFYATGVQPPRLGSGAPSAAPYRVYAASDGDFMLATASDPQFSRLCAALDKPTWAVDARFATMAARLSNRAQLDAVLAEEFRKGTLDSWLTRLGTAGLSVGAVHDIQQALAMPVVGERRLFVDPDNVGWKEGLPLWRLPIDPDGAGIKRPPPGFGAHTAEVLREFGFDALAIERLRIKT